MIRAERLEGDLAMERAEANALILCGLLRSSYSMWHIRLASSLANDS
jgi:hypothetical protein